MQTPSIGSRDFARFFRYLSILHRGRQRINRFHVSQVNTPLTCTNGRVPRLGLCQKKGVARSHAFSPDDLRLTRALVFGRLFSSCCSILSHCRSGLLNRSRGNRAQRRYNCCCSCRRSTGVGSVATAASPPLGVAGAVDVDSPDAVQLVSGCAALGVLPVVPSQGNTNGSWRPCRWITPAVTSRAAALFGFRAARRYRSHDPSRISSSASGRSASAAPTHHNARYCRPQ